jgi:hypothetical protein
MKKFIQLLFIWLLCGCVSARPNDITPTISAAPTSTVFFASTPILARTSTPTLTVTIIPTPFHPLIQGSPYPPPSAVISPQNAVDVVE